MVRRKNALEFKQLVRQLEQESASARIQPLSSEEFERRFGADLADVEAVTSFATEAELQATVFPHPTMSEAMHEASLDAYGMVLHI